MKRGYLTTEFWVLVITNVAVLAASLAEALPAKYAALFAAVSTSLYAVSRGVAKLTLPTAGGPGPRTTEFWATMIVNVGVLAAALADALPEKYAAYAAAVSTGAYAVARGVAKIVLPTQQAG